MTHLIDKDAVLAEIDERIQKCINQREEMIQVGCDTLVGDATARAGELQCLRDSINSLEVKEMGVWKTVDNINLPQADKNKIYCVFTKDRYILATVINNPKDEELLQWKCTEFPHHRYDMCEEDKYMQIV